MITDKLGPAVFWSLLTKGGKFVRGPLIMVSLFLYLTPTEQGIWYTFTSLALLSVLAELGFALIITQYVSQECAHLRKYNGFIRGPILYRDRLFSLVRYALKFYSSVVPIAIFLMIIIGYFILDGQSGDVKILWYYYSIISGFGLMASFIAYIYIGLGYVETVNRYMFISVLLSMAVTLSALWAGLGITSLIVGACAEYLSLMLLLAPKLAVFFKQMFRHKIQNNYGWGRELISLQGKYAVSWIAGYFMFQLFVPAVFRFSGAVEAGRMGATLKVIQMISSVSATWAEVRIPLINAFVSKNKIIEYRGLLRNTYKKCMVIYIVLSLGVLLVLGIMEHYSFYDERLLPIDEIFLFLLLQMSITVWSVGAIFVRAHKAEPFFMLSAACGVVVPIIIVFSLRENDILYMLQVLLLFYYGLVIPAAYLIGSRFLKGRGFG